MTIDDSCSFIYSRGSISGISSCMQGLSIHVNPRIGESQETRAWLLVHSNS